MSVTLDDLSVRTKILSAPTVLALGMAALTIFATVQHTLMERSVVELGDVAFNTLGHINTE